MKKRTQRIIIVILAAALLLSVLLPALSMLAGASSSTRQSINAIKQQISSNAAEMKELEKQLQRIEDEKAQAMEKKVILEQKVALLNEQIAATEAAIEGYNTLLAEKEAEIARLEQKQADQYELFCRQVRDMEETGSVSYLSILFSASSFSELLDYAMMISEVMEYHNGVIDALEATQQELHAAMADLETARSEQEELKTSLEADKAELLAQEAEVDKLIKEIEARADEFQEEIDKFEEAARALDKQLASAEAKYKKELAALENSAAASGDWYWPLPGRYYISSIFANRKHPITGKYGHHTGNDIPAPSGTEIHAANAGVVTEVGRDRVYGNYIQISHGNGYSTFYAHMKSTAIVKEGETVSRGQVIGYVGTTGWSTGNHLHFELRINGTRKDVLTLYPNLKFTY